MFTLAQNVGIARHIHAKHGVTIGTHCIPILSKTIREDVPHDTLMSPRFYGVSRDWTWRENAIKIGPNLIPEVGSITVFAASNPFSAVTGMRGFLRNRPSFKIAFTLEGGFGITEGIDSHCLPLHPGPENTLWVTIQDLAKTLGISYVQLATAASILPDDMTVKSLKVLFTLKGGRSTDGSILDIRSTGKFETQLVRADGVIISLREDIARCIADIVTKGYTTTRTLDWEPASRAI